MCHEEAGLTTVTVSERARAAFDIERVRKTFYREFDTHRTAFIDGIDGIDELVDRERYASIMLNRLMCVYFIQKKGFLDGDQDYLRHFLARSKQEQSKNTFHTFYRYFLLRLFHEGFGKRRKDRGPNLEKLLGNIPYLNVGLFDVHELEKPERYGKDISISDTAFEGVFAFFDDWQWHLYDRQLRNDREVNPDVIGHIFEKYINQKPMGAYYTQEDITEYISTNTVLPFLFDTARAKCKVAFDNPNGSTVWDLLSDTPDRYIYPAVKHGMDMKLPPDISVGLDPTTPHLIERRQSWNRSAPAAYALPTESWRDVVARRQRYKDIRNTLAVGNVREINDFITLNLDLRQFAQDVIHSSDDPALLRAFWAAILDIKVLDPTCGSGAFLFATLKLLQPLYETSLERMEAFIADDNRISSRSPDDTVRDLIALGESLTVGFKSDGCLNVKKFKAGKSMEQVIITTVAGFLNATGGDLLIGVQDDSVILGIAPDHPIVSANKTNRNYYKTWITKLLIGTFGKNHSKNILISFVRLEGKNVCRVAITKASTAVYIKEKNQNTLYVRMGKSTRHLTTSEAVAYHQQRFTNITPPPKAVEHSKISTHRKYADFRKIIKTVSAHQKRSYFICKNIILNNLFGVDIMEEAVDICKLRLFLKLAAQVEPDAAHDNLGIEPLPDIDFNIRAGNSLVGYATYDEVKHALTSTLDINNATKTIDIKAAAIQQTFDNFRQLQSEGDGSVPAADKLELQTRLKALENELHRHLASEYRVKDGEENAYAQWVQSHHPFHWFIQFYGILNNGGFDVIIGNPPYVASRKAQTDYRVIWGKTLSTNNLFSLVAERSRQLLNPQGSLGLILPNSSVSAKKMQPLQRVFRNGATCWVSNFAWRPSKLFDGANMLLAIWLMRRSLSETCYSTRYHRWQANYRGVLFDTISYLDATSLVSEFRIPKIPEVLAVSIIEKCRQKARGDTLLRAASGGAHILYYFRAVLYWLKVLTEPPVMMEDGVQTPTGEMKELRFDNEAERDAALAIMSSNLFALTYVIWSSCQVVNYPDLMFPVNLMDLTRKHGDNLSKLAAQLMGDLKDRSTIQTRHYSARGRTFEMKKQYFYYKESKPIVDKIDTIMAEYYGFTVEELDFILNYDIKYRVGIDNDADEA